jgi:hypothetical protein
MDDGPVGTRAAIQLFGFERPNAEVHLGRGVTAYQPGHDYRGVFWQTVSGLSHNDSRLRNLAGGAA